MAIRAGMPRKTLNVGGKRITRDTKVIKSVTAGRGGVNVNVMGKFGSLVKSRSTRSGQRAPRRWNV